MDLDDALKYGQALQLVLGLLGKKSLQEILDDVKEEVGDIGDALHKVIVAIVNHFDDEDEEATEASVDNTTTEDK